MPTFLPLIFPMMSAIIAITFTLIALEARLSQSARAAAVGFFALAICIFIDTQRSYLAPSVIFLVVPLQLCTIAALCQAAVARVGKSLPRALVTILFVIAIVLHAHWCFVDIDPRARGLTASLASATLMLAGVAHLRGTLRTPVDRLMLVIVGWTALTFVVRAALIASGLIVLDPHASWAGRGITVAMSAIHILTTMIWSFGLLLAIGKDLINLQHQVTLIDPLTALGNRRAFDAAMHADEQGGPLYGSVLIVDLDHFKRVNDTYGHDVGDIVLRNVAGLLSTRLSPFGVVARIGGEEFAVLVARDQTHVAAALARTTLVEVARLAMPHKLLVTASIGLASREPGENLQDLMRRADRALYQAKDAGRNRVAIAEAAGSDKPAETPFVQTGDLDQENGGSTLFSRSG